MRSWLNYFLLPAFILYRSFIVFKNFCYDKSLLKSSRLPCRVISIGNLTFGGTGKTPTVLYLCKFFQIREINDIAILSRGYKRKTRGTVLVSKGKGPLEKWQNVGDEPFMMAKKTKNIPIVVDNNRFRGGCFLIKNFNTKIIILDDGFQHRSLYRDFDIVLMNGSSLPSDYSFFSMTHIREGWGSLKRADSIIFTKSKPKFDLLKKIEKEKIFYSKSITKSNVVFPKNIIRQKLKKKKVVLLSGIGDPKSFEKIAKQYECKIVGTMTFRDHCNYTDKILFEVIEFANNVKANYILTTEKDWVKLRPLNPIFPFVVLKIQLKILGNKNIEKVLEKKLSLNLSHAPSKYNADKS